MNNLIRKLFKKPLLWQGPFELDEFKEQLDKLSTELQEKISKIAKDKKELEAILSSMMEGVVVINRQETILLLSAPVSGMLELRTKEVVGRPFWEVIRNEEVNSLLKETLLTKKALRKELTTVFPDERYFIAQISPVLDEKNDLSDVVAVFHDITELKKLEKMRTEFVANVSHELKTPLTSIKGFVETLQGEALEDKKTALRFLDIIQKHTQRLENLVTDLLNLSSIESKESPVNPSPVGVNIILDGVISLYKEQLSKKRQEMRVEIPSGISKIYVDKEKIELVFSNLIDNAIKFTPEGGKIFLRATDENGFIRVDVEDTGIGIPPEHLSRIFERFYRVNKSRSRELGGTGLGLAIVKHIVQAHRGKVSVKSDPNKGAVFSVSLPKDPS